MVVEIGMLHLTYDAAVGIESQFSSTGWSPVFTQEEFVLAVVLFSCFLKLADFNLEAVQPQPIAQFLV